ncbi:hypothetical protein KO493_01815 [Tamlana agarivorans]|uniref:Uncharacterized protein n=1 Tax=Pseudotamlana agarivorans TaxID=481183 RepID=A0ACC5U532_9FLAO|nr:hypothetical protein [Tamlana agarivorans]MBU2949427.1 hypothetical protein [Tamlana agarivorans]
MRYLYILLISFFFAGCSSIPKEYLSNNHSCHYNNVIFNISNEELVLNPNILKQLKNKQESIILVDNENYQNRFSNLSSSKIINYQTNKKLDIAKWIVYQKNGIIESSEFIYLNGTKSIFKEYHYNEKGNITKIIDHEKGYNICWAEAIEIVKHVAKIDIEKYEVTAYNLSRVDLNEFPNEKPQWAISLSSNKAYERKDTKVYWIDGVTGVFLKTTKIITTHD